MHRSFVLAFILTLFPLYTVPDVLNESDIVPLHKIMPGKTPLTYRRELYITFENAIGKYKTKEAFVVDIRDAADFQQLRIPGSLNIPLFAVKTKSFLKSKSIILVNSGHEYSTVQNDTVMLRQNGFDVSILWGGLYYWYLREAPMEGDRFKAASLSVISPDIFFHERNYANWNIIDTSSVKTDVANYFKGGIHHIPYSGTEFLTVVRNVFKHDRNCFFMILNKDGTGYAEIKADLKRIAIQEVFFLQGGFQAYRRTFEKQMRIMKKERQNMGCKKKDCRCPSR